MRAIGDIDLDKLLGVIGREQRHCEEHGEYESLHTQRAGREHWSQCPTCVEALRQAELQEQHERQVREREQKRLERLLGGAGIPPRFEGITFDTYAVQDGNAKQSHHLEVLRDYAANFREHHGSGEGLLLMGAKGTGKTHLATAAAQYVITTHGMMAVYTIATKMFRRLKDTFSRSGETEGEVIRAYANPDLLIIDEIGMGHCSPTELGHLFEIINERYEHRLPTILITNIDNAADLEAWVGERTMDRLREGGKALLFDWPSHRDRRSQAKTAQEEKESIS